MAAPQASSRLELLQARFQQKRLQEKEQKLLQLYDQQQQRAHQVAQRGSAGSNDSAHTGMMNQQSVTRNSSTINSNATSQGGKVRQMFDERRQTNIKGIDKSYPLEPLDNNKPKKHVVQSKHGNAANRQRVVMRRVARADINSNVNGGKSVVSYHENGKEDYANENETTFINGHLRNGNRHELNAGELIADDALDRNRMLAKLHTMDFDKSGKHRSSNDLDAEQFPEELEVDVPDKVPRKPTTKKLSPAEARLERFKNANTKKASATITKKRSEPTTPTGNSSPKTPSPTTSPKRVTNGDSKNSSPRKSAPSSPSKSPELQTKQSSPTTGQRPPSSQSNASSGGSNRSQPSTEVKSGMATKAKSKASKKAPPVKVATPVTPPKPPVPPSCDSIGNLVACSMCGRKFADDRITLHEEICQRTGHKRRKQFDAMTHRVKGTELEPFVKHGLPPKEKSQRPDVRSSNWRRKHEDFINAIRSAKQVKAHLAAGGKLSDLPPPPPSDTSDYIQCPHCGRKFNQGAAERHIPKCQHMLHNKPNPRAPPKPKR